MQNALVRLSSKPWQPVNRKRRMKPMKRRKVSRRKRTRQLRPNNRKALPLQVKILPKLRVKLTRVQRTNFCLRKTLSLRMARQRRKRAH